MTKEQVIEQLKSLKADRESFIQNDKEHDKFFLDDIEAIETVLSMLEEQEYKLKQLGKGQQVLIQSRKKWKRRYYKMKDKNKNLQNKIIDLMANHIATSDSDLCEYLDITTKCKYYAGDNGKTCDNCIKQYFENKAKEIK